VAPAQVPLAAQLAVARFVNAISPAVQMMVCYLPGLVGVMDGKPPAQALSEVDADCNCGE
jgi:hypothetical protein